jgi:hypothetical protein
MLLPPNFEFELRRGTAHFKIGEASTTRVLSGKLVGAVGIENCIHFHKS